MTGTNTYATTDFAGVFPEVWSDYINWQYEAKLLAAKFFLDFSDDVGDGGQKIHIPDAFTNTFSANNKTVGSEVTLQSPTTVDSNFTINTWKEVSFLIEDFHAAAILKSQSLQQGLAEKASYTVAKALDSSLLALVTGLSVIVNDSASDVVDADIRNAISKLDGVDVPAEDRAFFFHPDVVWQDLFGIAKYYDAATLGLQNGPITSGQLPALYNIPIYQTTNLDATLTSYQNALVHKSALGFAVANLGNANLRQPAVFDNGEPYDYKVRVQSSYIHENLGTLTTCDVMYATTEVRDAAGVWIKSRKTGFIS